MNRIVLVMIARNEERVIGRCLGAALPHVDGVVLCVNGTTDGTREEAARVASLLDKPLHLVEHEWKNFGVNRTLSARAAEEWCRVQEWPLEQTWFLLLDADMVLRGDINAAALDLDSYNLIQKHGALEYPNVRLVRASRGWRADDEPTHEYWRADGPEKRGDIKGAWIDDRCDGANRADKFDRDIRLLTEALQLDPARTRARFYLAESYFNSQRYAEAADHYAQRAEQKGYEAERWYARFKHGVSLLKLGRTEFGAGVLLRAFEERPSRAEPLFELGKHYRETERWQSAALVLERALGVSKPASDLFVDVESYGSALHDELTLVWYRTGKRDKGRGLCETLARRVANDSKRAAHVACTLSWYAEPVARYRDVPLWETEGAFDGVEYSPCNPSVALVGKYHVRNIRLVNYDQRRGRHYKSRAADGIIRTENIIVPGDAEAHLLRDEIPSSWNHSCEVRGLEDIRLFEYQGRAWFTATCCQVPGANGAPRVVLGRLSEDLRRVDHLVPLAWKRSTACEKNWLPWVLADGKLRVIYRWHPFTVLVVDAETGQCKAEDHWRESHPVARRWRGSAPPVAWRDRWLAVVHDVARLHDRNVYMHRLVELDGGGVRSNSPAFRLGKPGIEYVAGAVLVEGGLLLTYGVEDREARELVVPESQLERWFGGMWPASLPSVAA